MTSDPRDPVERCYSTWGESYYDEYYSDRSAYPPVHRDLVRRIVRESKAANLLDAGCGPASLLRDLCDLDLELYGFDLTREMVEEAKKVMAARGHPPERFWQGSVREPRHFRASAPGAPERYDAAICIGVLPHVSEGDDALVLRNLHSAVKPGGTVTVEARNALFSLFTVNRYAHEFFDRELCRTGELADRIGAERVAAIRAELASHVRMDLPPVRTGKRGEPGYDEIVSRSHNPLVLVEQFRATGFRDVRLLFYHFHRLPPLFEKAMPELFRELCLEMERDPEDWRGHFMASAFLVTGVRV
jgi:2-polyprenyl-3-methyl-5-hydroxy-6-metoxy-1,4-benzoquinol methylase